MNNQQLTPIRCGRCGEEYQGLTPGPASVARLNLYHNPAMGYCSKCITYREQDKFTREVDAYYVHKAKGGGE